MGAEPLRRQGDFVIPLVEDGGNELPKYSARPVELAQLWNTLVMGVVGVRVLRDKEGNPSGEVRGVPWRYRDPIELYSAEAILALWHQVLAPDAEFLCDERCPHVVNGATPEQIKRILDAMDATLDALEERLRSPELTRKQHFELQSQHALYRTWRREISALVDDSSFRS